MFTHLPEVTREVKVRLDWLMRGYFEVISWPLKMFCIAAILERCRSRLKVVKTSKHISREGK